MISKPTVKNRRILIVEDDNIFSYLYERNVRTIDQNAEVTQARDGYQALTTIATGLPDAIVMDIGMPSLDGCEFLRIVKTKAEYAAVPIIVITSSPALYAEEINGYPNTYLFRKPLTAKLLHSVIANLLVCNPTMETSGAQVAHMDCYVGPDVSAQKGLVDLFYETAPDRIVELHQLHKLGNVRLLKNWCHGMKGTTSILGAKDLQSQIESLSKTLHTATQIELQKSVDSITNAIRKAAVDLNKLFKKEINKDTF